MPRTEMTQRLRPYGPGKYDTILDAHVHEISTDWLHMESGNVSEIGKWAGTVIASGEEILEEINDRSRQRQAEARGEYSVRAHGWESPLHEHERTFLTETAAIMIVENDQGFVDVSYYETEKECEEAFSEFHSEHNICYSCGQQVDEDHRWCSKCKDWVG